MEKFDTNVKEHIAPPDLRIQSKSDVIKMGGFAETPDSHKESVIFTERMNKIGLKTGRTMGDSLLKCIHYNDDPNKGYPKGFTDHNRYDPKK